ncbi:shugoshin c terminal domain-containing protein [Colletotrichum truncatum]|uniref:Shugoshin c terminal domain-containing protein n=1 Tax=Colletotrichum truncatum TaxID=5467 RepID=A0ACC3Z9G7_COLTU|nr:shugoshin c terminal domain-containing protein [Colletotrichum truncatum]KAF6793645.1 shugoshin c terminal domain-containing protein [Colletotrichum truncatum]
MARLNEPPVSADSIDTLRRKLLRQNRDLAKANAVHLVRIRNIEADYARSLSDNLRLESRVIELEKELENNNARRIADHALDVRSRLEAQLLECMSVLAGLGQEPPTKRHASPRGRRSSRASLPHQSPPRRRPPRELLKETEGRVQDDGRLPTITENKSYTRATMDREQILALCSEAADTTDTIDTADATDSPELGPPPMSRFVDGEGVDIGSPSRSTEQVEPEPAVYNSPVASPSLAPMPSPAPTARSINKTEKAILVRPDPDPAIDDAEPEKPRPKETPILPPVVPPTAAKTGSKRKYSMGDEVLRSDQKGAEPSKPRDGTDRPTIGRERQGGKTLKELANIRREARERMIAPVNPRKPLSAKSTNDDVTSPTKNPKGVTGESKVVVEKPKSRAARERAAQKIREAEIEADVGPSPIEVPVGPPSPPPPVVDVLPSTENVPTEASLLSPASPEPTSRMSLSSVRDTPPPADISSHGETSRPSRRSRAAVSYAEPNLRDKMRRPTKELHDAVSGQTKYLQRSGSARSDSATPEGMVMIKRESSNGDAWREIPPASSNSMGSPQRIANLAELTDNAPSIQPPISTTKPDRKKRTSSMMSKSISEMEEERSVRQAQDNSPDRAISGRPTPSPDREVDPYEFTSSTPGSDSSHVIESKENVMSARQSKSSRRLSSVMKEDFKLDGMETTERSKASGSRKRASMVLPKRSRADVEGAEDSSFESVDNGDIQDAGSRVSMRRRRSMML